MKRTLADFATAMQGRLTGADGAFSALSTDTRTCAAGDLFLALSGDHFDGHDYVATAAERGVAGVVVTRAMDVAVPQIIVDDTLLALQRAAAAWRQNFDYPIVAVAGSNGKTTTKELIATVLAVKGSVHSTRGTLNNHIGVPMTLLALDESHACAVIEIGANHPGEVATLVQLVAPTVGVVTNAGAEHLEGFGSVEGAARAEGELFAGLAPTATAVINADDDYAGLWREQNAASTVITFGLAGSADCSVDGIIAETGRCGEAQAFTLTTPQGAVRVSLPLLGKHNVSNALAAAAVGTALGLSPASIATSLSTVSAVKGRLQLKVATAGGLVIDDSYNANPSSLAAALTVLGRVSAERWLVLGDMAELGEETKAAHATAGAAARTAGVDRLFTFGADAALAAATFGAGAESFDDIAALQDGLRGRVEAGIAVLVKGSRVNRLERVVDMLVGADRKGG